MTAVAPPEEPTLYLIDGYALIYRAFFALLSRPLTTARGENTSAAWGVANFLIRLIGTRHPSYIVWVHDSGQSFRHEKHPAYKATREKLSEELRADFERGLQRIDQLLRAYGIPIVAVAGYEADDVIGTLARRAKERGLHAVIVSGDKDFQQCVEPGVWLLNPGRGGPAAVDEQFVGMANAAERLGVSPDRVTDYLALVGDSSDNVPGVPGIGEKTARELIEQFGDLDQILANAAHVAKKRPREALLTFADQARLSKDLVTIRTDVPVELDLDAFKARSSDATQLRHLYLELEFTSLLKGLEEPTRKDDSPAPTQYRIVSDVAQLEEMVRKAGQQGVVGVATSITADADSTRDDDPLRSQLTGLALAIAPGESYYVPFRRKVSTAAQGDLLLQSAAPPVHSSRVDEPVEASTGFPALPSPSLGSLVELLGDSGVRKLVHDAKHTVLALGNAGLSALEFQFDTMLASYVLDPGRRAHDLELLSLEFLDHTMGKVAAGAGDPTPGAAQDAGVVRGVCERADVTLRLHAVLASALREQQLDALLDDVELPLVRVLVAMERAGIAIDVSWFRSLKERFQRERQRVEGEIYEAAGERFNVNSNQQLRTILFDRLQLPIKKRTATGPSTDASVLQELADEGHHLPLLLMEYRELSKLESTYIDALPRLVHPRDGRLHTSFNQTVAATGRLSSSDPNLQNIPIRRELGRDIRRGFVAQAGWKLVAADYSQIELRLLAHLSHDRAFVEAFSRGGDIHRETAAIIFGVEGADVTSEMRSRAKTINFATIYGQGANALARQLKITNAEAREFITTYFERFRGVREYLDAQVVFAKERGYVETILRRRRYIPELRDRNFNIRAFGERVATNAPIQGSAADLIKLAMIKIHERLLAQQAGSRMLLQVHDELVFEVPTEELDWAQDMVKHEMESAATLDVPLVVDLGIGSNWLETKSH